MTKRRIHLRSFRREQIVDAAVAVIAEQGIQHLSLSQIERKTGLVRGQLTYYRKRKEDILLGVFGRLIDGLRDWTTAVNYSNPTLRRMPHGWERAGSWLTAMLRQPPMTAAFCSLQYTFLSEVNRREDYRARLAKVLDGWRKQLAEDVAVSLANNPGGRSVAPEAFAALVLAALHGLALQRALDPDAFDCEEMLELLLDLLGNSLSLPVSGQPRRRRTTLPTKGSPS